MLRLSYPYTAMRSDVAFLQTKQNVYHINYWRWSFYTHVFTSSFVLLAGLTQFNNYLQQKQKKIHRAIGYVYVLVVVFVTGPASFLMGLNANGGMPARASFTLLSILWITFTALAWRFATKRNLEQHRAFMIRSYALTLSAITLRIYTFLFAYFNVDLRPVEIYILTAWLSWLPNLIIAQVLIKFKKSETLEILISK